MDKLYYGSGSCTLQSSSAVGLEIKYRGAIKITDKTPEGYNIISNSKKILIFPTGIVEPLTNLFEYTGNFKVRSVLASDINGERVYLTIKKVMDYPELMESNAEDMTEIAVENMNAGYQHKGRVSQTTTDNKIVKNQRSEGELYLIDGSAYSGPYHVHIDTGKAMTGGEHNRGSQNLYTMRAKDGILVPTGGDRDWVQEAIDTPWGKLYTSLNDNDVTFGPAMIDGMGSATQGVWLNTPAEPPLPGLPPEVQGIRLAFEYYDWIGVFTEDHVLCGAYSHQLVYPLATSYEWAYEPTEFKIHGLLNSNPEEEPPEWAPYIHELADYPTIGDPLYFKVFRVQGIDEALEEAEGWPDLPNYPDNQTFNAYPKEVGSYDFSNTSEPVLYGDIDNFSAFYYHHEFWRLDAFTNEPYHDWYEPGGVSEFCKKFPRHPRCMGASTPQIR